MPLPLWFVSVPMVCFCPYSLFLPLWFISALWFGFAPIVCFCPYGLALLYGLPLPNVLNLPQWFGFALCFEFAPMVWLYSYGLPLGRRKNRCKGCVVANARRKTDARVGGRRKACPYGLISSSVAFLNLVMSETMTRSPALIPSVISTKSKLLNPTFTVRRSALPLVRSTNTS